MRLLFVRAVQRLQAACCAMGAMKTVAHPCHAGPVVPVMAVARRGQRSGRHAIRTLGCNTPRTNAVVIPTRVFTGALMWKEWRARIGKAGTHLLRPLGRWDVVQGALCEQ